MAERRCQGCKGEWQAAGRTRRTGCCACAVGGWAKAAPCVPGGGGSGGGAKAEKVLAVASLPRSEGSSNREQRAVCRDGPVWAQSCSFTEIYVAGKRHQRWLSTAAAHKDARWGRTSRSSRCAWVGHGGRSARRWLCDPLVACCQQAGGRRAWQSIGEARAVGGGRPVAEACRLPGSITSLPP